MEVKPNKSPIDAVILWVDGDDAVHQEKIQSYLHLQNVFTTNSRKFNRRFAQVNEIEYTVNSILKFAPFIRNIFIVTDNQIPDFLKTNKDDYQNVSIIDHTTIFSGHEEFLPTFNNRSIETCIYRIPNLSEHFIYLNDDFFLINPTQPDDFFKNGLPILRGKWLKFDENIFYKKFKEHQKGHKYAQQNAAKLLGFKEYYNFKHTPHPIRKSTLQKYFEENQDIFIENIKHKFRSSTQILIQGLAYHLEIKNKTCVLKLNKQLFYLRSYKKPLLWYKFKLTILQRNTLFFAMQNLDAAPPKIQTYLLNWLKNRVFKK